MNPFQGAVAIVTGGGSGIGRALCVELAARGANVIVTDVNAATARDTASTITNGGGRARALPLDVTDADAVKRLVDGVAADEGRIDYMFNNAGIVIIGEELDVSLEDWRRVLDVNLNGVLYGVRAAYPIMVRQKSGHIVNTASVAGLIPVGTELSYSATKYAVVGLSHGLRVEGAALGVKVTVVCPGFVETPLLTESPIRMPVPAQKLRGLLRNVMEVGTAAREILDGVAKNKATVVVTAHGKLAYFLNRLSPSFGLMVAERVVGRVRKARAEG